MKKTILIIISLLIHATAALAQLPQRVDPLLPDQWDQYGPLTRQTPLIDGQHTTVGCVALALAQVMHYWRYPERGTGSITYTDSIGCGQTLSVDFSKQTYKWSDMLDVYTEGQYTEKQADAAAYLCRDCGYAVHMRYGLENSGARTVRQAIALRDYFGYDQGVQFYIRDFYTTQEMTLMLKTELASGRPVLIAGYNQNGGHAFVIDGYDENDWFHINLGNPDAPDDGDGWTPLNCMAPNSPQWYDPDRPEQGLNVIQMFVMGVMPSTHPDATHTRTHLYAMQCIESADSTSRLLTDSIHVCTRDLCNIGSTLHDDSVSLMLTLDGTIIDTLYTYTHTFLLEETDDTTYTDTLALMLPQNLAAGQYHIQPMYHDGGQWKRVLTSLGTPGYLIAQTTSDSVTLLSDTTHTAYLTLEDLYVPDMMINTFTPEYNLTVRCHNADLHGRIYLHMDPVDPTTHQPLTDGESFDLNMQGIALQKDQQATYTFRKTKLYVPHTGTYRLRVMYDSNILSGERIDISTSEIYVTVIHASNIELAFR